jgi:hypothetical protein
LKRTRRKGNKKEIGEQGKKDKWKEIGEKEEKKSRKKLKGNVERN